MGGCRCYYGSPESGGTCTFNKLSVKGTVCPACREIYRVSLNGRPLDPNEFPDLPKGRQEQVLELEKKYRAKFRKATDKARMLTEQEDENKRKRKKAGRQERAGQKFCKKKKRERKQFENCSLRFFLYNKRE